MHSAQKIVELSDAERRSKETPAAYSEDKMTQAFRNPPTDWLDVGHSQLAYRSFGSGPDIVFIHGWPLSSATFRHAIAPLAERYTCHVFDLPGAGQTKCTSDTPIDLSSHAATVRSAINVLGLERFGLVAHDSGAVIARLVAADAGDRVSGLVASGTEIPGHRPWLVALYVQSARLPGGAAMLRWLMKSRLVRRSFLGFGGCFHDLSLADGDFHDFFVRPFIESAAVGSGQIQLLKNLDWSIIDGLQAVHQRITAPVRLIWGADDPLFPAGLARQMLRQFPAGGDFVEIPRSKLFVHEERPNEFALHTREFFDGLTGSGVSQVAS